MDDSHPTGRGKHADPLGTIRGCWKRDAFTISAHALQRMAERGVDLADLENAVLHGRREPRKDVWKPEFQRWTYALRGETLEGAALRVAVSIERDWARVVTVIRLTIE